jgi:hypothetical protein
MGATRDYKLAMERRGGSSGAASPVRHVYDRDRDGRSGHMALTSTVARRGRDHGPPCVQCRTVLAFMTTQAPPRCIALNWRELKGEK